MVLGGNAVSELPYAKLIWLFFFLWGAVGCSLPVEGGPVPARW